MKEKILATIPKLNTVEDVDYLIDKIKRTSTINRRTKAGRELTEELLNACNRHVIKIINEQGITPF